MPALKEALLIALTMHSAEDDVRETIFEGYKGLLSIAQVEMLADSSSFVEGPGFWANAAPNTVVVYLWIFYKLTYLSMQTIKTIFQLFCEHSVSAYVPPKSIQKMML